MKQKPDRKCAVFFDADDTLFSLKEPTAVSYSRCLKKFGFSVSPERLGQQIAEIWPVMEPAYLRTASCRRTAAECELSFWYGFVKKVLLPFLSLADIRMIFPELYRNFSMPESKKLHTDIHNAARQLSDSGHPVGVITNHDARCLPSIFHYYPFIESSRIITAVESGLKKPSIQLFSEVKKQVWEPGFPRPVYVGNNPAVDCLPASLAGWQAICYDPGRKPGPNPVPRIRLISSGSELIAAVQEAGG